MFFLESIRLAFGALLQNKMRSLLTMLGIIIGISSVITITTIGNSLKHTLNNTFNMLFDTSMYFQYHWIGDSENYEYSDEDYERCRVTMEMMNGMEEQFGGKYLTILDAGVGSGHLTNDRGQRINVAVMGGTEGYFITNASYYKLLEGRVPNRDDDAGCKHTVYVSDVFVRQYFANDENPLGQSISVDIDGLCNAELVIVGVYQYPQLLDKHVQQGVSEIDKKTPIYVPYHTALKFSNAKEDARYAQVICADGDYDIKDAMAELQEYFDGIYQGKDYNWAPRVTSDEDTMGNITKVLNIVTIAISVIAAISLLVGGIGVMNIMLVSITERTREIGVRKAIGAKSGTIKLQFLIEAIILSLVGAIIGVILGILGGIFVGYVARMFLASDPMLGDMVSISIVPSMSAIMISLFFSMLIGMFFGSYPASKAAKMNPIDALRYE